MKNFITQQIDKVAKLTTKERNLLLCQLVVKEHFGTIMPDETVQLAFIQAIRTANGEIDKVLKSWKENPELDPRIQTT